jgi:S-disulfanyl-L-cysteine oxidoreductase SoxD
MFMRRIAIPPVALTILLALSFGTYAHAASSRTVLDGVYTDAQAARGLAAFRANCMRCHADNLLGQGSAPLTGAVFMDRWREDGLDTLFDDMRTRMPNDNPGALPPNTYLDILTYILKVSTFPAGAAELTVETLPSTQLVGKDGPKPLPSNSLAAAVGCITPGMNNSWTLTQAAEPARTKDEEETTPEEKQASAAKPLGQNSFRLQTSTRAAIDFSFDTYKGQKVLAKGVLIREAGNDRIRVTSMESLSPACAP